MYEYTPKRKNANALTVSILLLIAGFTLFALPSVLPIPMKGIWQLIGMLLVGLAIFVSTRYLLKTYRYAVRQAHDGGYDLVVTECQGRRRDVVCRLLLTNLSGLRPYDKAAKDAYRGQRIHNYCIDLFPRDAYLFFFDDWDKEGNPSTLLILISPDDRLLSLCAPYVSSVS